MADIVGLSERHSAVADRIAVSSLIPLIPKVLFVHSSGKFN